MSGGQLVTVGCKLPNGILLELAGKNGAPPRRVRLRGSAEARRTESGASSEDTARVIRGFGLTKVAEEFWNEWEARYRKANYEPLAQGLIFKEADDASAQARAREQGGDLRSGLEPVDPAKSGPAPIEGVSKIETLAKED